MLTRDEFQPIYDQGPDAVFAVIATLQEHVASLTARVKALEDRLAQDSHNSSKPPSSDGFKKQPVSLRKPSGKKPGGQKGHPGRTLTLRERPDEVIPHTPAHCACCGRSLADVSGQAGERRQVLDLPPLSLLVTEHRLVSKVCPDCGQTTRGQFPVRVTQAVQYGPRVAGLGVYLLDYQLLPYARIAGLFADLFAAPLSKGTLGAFQQSAAARLEPLVAGIRQALRGAQVAHFDETGVRVSGRLHWLHSAGTPTLTYYAWHPSRGNAGMDKAGILTHFGGIAVHDGWTSYQRYACRHALCNAHHLRELTALYEQDGQEWAKQMRSLLVEIKHTVERAKEQGRTRLSPLLEIRFEARYRKLLQAGFAANPPPKAIPGKRGRAKQNRARNLLERLHRFARQTLAFMYEFAVPFDNNLAERDIRMMKVQQKVSGGFRSQEGAEAFCRIRSYLSTMRKQGYSVLSALEQVFLGKPLCPQI